MQLVIAKALGKTRDPLAVAGLVRVLQSNKSRCVCVAAAKALERIGTLEALAVVKQWRFKQKVSS
jgi:HEAT repeat protein